MKTTKRFIAMAAALTLSACAAMPMAMMSASAAGVYVDTTSGDSTNGYMADAETHTYTAYPIFTGTYSDEALTVTGWADGYDSDGLIADTSFQAMKTGSTDGATVAKDMNDITTGGGTIGAKEVSKMLEDIKTYDSGKIDELAQILYKYKGTAGTTLSHDSTTPTNLDVGYYVVDDSYTASDTNNDALSKYILRVATGDDIKITPKKSYPTVEKKVKEDDKTVTGTPVNDSATTEKWNDVADYDIGEAVPFKLYGTMPSSLGDYAHYYYKFTDTLGSQFDQPTALTIKVGSTTLTATWDSTNNKYTVTGDTGTNCRVTWDSTNHKIVISFEDIKAYADVTASTVVTVEYNAVLNNTANIGLPGQVNAVKLTYSNNPNFEYSPDTSDDNEDTPKDDKGTPSDEDDEEQTDETPEDKVIVFTYELDVNKIDGTKRKALQGAEFTLKNSDNKYAKVDSTGKFLGWVDATITDTAGTTTLTSGEDGIFKVIGIDDGTYTLTETKAPADYTALAAPVTLEIVASTVNDQSWNNFAPTDALASISLNGTEQDTGTADGKRGHVTQEVENNKGATLPTTGGMGTTMFILSGGCTAALAGIYLISKKRTKEE